MNGTANNKENLIYLTDKEAELFTFFRKYQDIWERAKKECRPGSLVLHFDKDFNIGKKEFHSYEKKTLDKLTVDNL